jgi:hypothetical protein
MTTQTAERQDIYQKIDALSETAVEKLGHYIAFLRYEDWIEDQEDAEDIEYIKSLAPEEYANAIPESEVIAEYEAKYGLLD